MNPYPSTYWVGATKITLKICLSRADLCFWYTAYVQHTTAPGVDLVTPVFHTVRGVPLEISRRDYWFVGIGGWGSGSGGAAWAVTLVAQGRHPVWSPNFVTDVWAMPKTHRPEDRAKSQTAAVFFVCGTDKQGNSQHLQCPQEAITWAQQVFSVPASRGGGENRCLSRNVNLPKSARVHNVVVYKSRS